MNENNDEVDLIANREDLALRNRFQIRVLKMKFGDDEQAQLEWIDKNSKSISDIIDDPKNTQVRYLIEQGRSDPSRYDEAAKLVIAILNSPREPKKQDDVQMAA